MSKSGPILVKKRRQMFICQADPNYKILEYNATLITVFYNVALKTVINGVIILTPSVSFHASERTLTKIDERFVLRLDQRLLSLPLRSLGKTTLARTVGYFTPILL